MEPLDAQGEDVYEVSPWNFYIPFRVADYNVGVTDIEQQDRE